MGADKLFTGGVVRTGDTQAPVSDAVAVVDGVVVALGADARLLHGPDTDVIDLAGGALLPSFGDGHAHPLLGGVALTGVPVRDCRSVEEIVAAVSTWAIEHPDKDWICGDAFDPTLAPDGRFDAHWLDGAVPDRPVVLRTMDHHTAWVNSAALRLAGIDERFPEPPDGQILRRPDGTPLGTLREWGALDLVMDLIPAATRTEQVAALTEVSHRFAAAGITWAQDAWVEHADVQAWLAAAELGVLSFRANLAFRAEPGGWKNDIDDFVADRALVDQQGLGLLTARTVKFFADGVIESGTAALVEPYDDCPHSHGMATWSPEELADAMAAVDRLGFQAHIHAIGDAGVRMALDAIAETERRNGSRDRRPTVAHVQLIDPSDLDRFARLGVIANVEPLWAQPDDLMIHLTLPRIGAARGARQYQIASLLASGAHVSFGSDWPVSSYAPLAGISTAITRQTTGREPADGWHPAERITLDQAVTAYTSGVAYQAFEENAWGVIRPGARADLVHLAEDPAAVPAGDLGAIDVLGTWLAGTRTH